MLTLKNLSFRYKIALRGSALVVTTAVLLTSVLVAREHEELRRDLDENAVQLGTTLSQNLISPIVQDDVWRAYQLLRAPLATDDSRARERLPTAIVLFDRNLKVLASSSPTRYPLLSDPEALPGFGGVAPWVRASPTLPSTRVIDADEDTIALVMPIVADGVSLAHLALVYSDEGIRARAARLVERSVLYTLGLLALILPITWYWGHRMAQPLVQLADGMSRVGTSLPDEVSLDLEESQDEIGRAGTAFRNMLAVLRQQAALEQEVMVNERLAALGRLAAGVAHEINNPLGGMLNAVDTWRRHGGDRAQIDKTLSMIERGLLQIRDTVSALLVEAKPSGKPLAREDFDDIHTLIASDLSSHGVQLDWTIRLEANVYPLPATLVRQVLLNLLLNAIQAVPAGGRVELDACVERGVLRFEVANEGCPIPPERLGTLFEPLISGRPQGHGLGLWVSYQIVNQLGGRIAVRSDASVTRFIVELPVGPATGKESES